MYTNELSGETLKALVTTLTPVAKNLAVNLKTPIAIYADFDDKTNSFSFQVGSMLELDDRGSILAEFDADGEITLDTSEWYDHASLIFIK